MNNTVNGVGYSDAAFKKDLINELKKLNSHLQTIENKLVINSTFARTEDIQNAGKVNDKCKCWTNI